MKTTRLAAVEPARTSFSGLRAPDGDAHGPVGSRFAWAAFGRGVVATAERMPDGVAPPSGSPPCPPSGARARRAHTRPGLDLGGAQAGMHTPGSDRCGSEPGQMSAAAGGARRTQAPAGAQSGRGRPGGAR